MKVIITMAGMGSRFTKIGIQKPKHEIIANSHSLFYWSMRSLIDFFDETFIFICRKGAYNETFIKLECEQLGIHHFEIIALDELTDGQAATTLFADKFIQENDAVLIYNIDTYIEEDQLKKNDIPLDAAGYLPAFDAVGDKWSFVQLKSEDSLEVKAVSEKVRISNLGTIGLYYFNNWSKFKSILDKNKQDIIRDYKESYIAPMYKYLIDHGNKVYTSIIPTSKIHVLGTPEDVIAFDPEYLNSNS